MKYITLFETAAAYNAVILDLPNVSLIEENMDVAYNPYVTPETRVVAKYNVTSTSSPTALRTNYEQNVFKSMEIDGVMLDELVTEYVFDTIGEHIVKYELYDETKLGNQSPVFMNNNLVECIIPDSVTSIDSYAFYSCSSLTSITIPDSVTSIGNYTFSNCSSLTSITIPDSVTSIGSNAFAGCSGLTSIIIPNSVTSIGSAVFNGCSNLISIDIPDSVTSIGGGALDINALKVLNYNAKCAFSIYFRGAWKNLETVIIGDSTPSIGDRVFSDCSSLTSVTIGNGVTSIGDSAFRECSSLTNIVSNAMTAPAIQSSTFQNINTDGTLTVPSGSTGYDTWMSTDDYYLGKYNWTKVEQ